MKLQRMWTMSVALCLAAGLAGYGDEPKVISEGPKLAKGSFHQLPEDGTSAFFTMDLLVESVRSGAKPRDTANPMKGSVTVSSVGRTTLNGEACRWIEVKVIFFGQPLEDARVEVWKVLIPEKHLETGQSPMEHVVKGWHLHQFFTPAEDGIDLKSKPTIGNETLVTELAKVKEEARRAGLLRLCSFSPWFCGPMEDVKKLDKAVIETGLGKLECEGITGKLTFPDSKGKRMHVCVEKRLHDKAPFGIVSSETRVWFEAENVHGGTRKLKLMETSENAESELPKW